jgi:hypothetical protein
MRVYHYLEAKWALENIRRRRLKLSKIDDMNDPWEWKSVCSDDNRLQEALDKSGTHAFDEFGVACFSRSWNNILMWSHYGEKHKGICLGFDVPDELIRTVIYEREIEVVGSLADSPIEHVMIEGKRIIDKLFETKYKGWCYEDEIRVHGRREEKDEETGFYFSDFDDGLILKEVIAGPRYLMSRKPIEAALKSYSEDVKIMKTTTLARRFEVVIDENGFRDAQTNQPETV